jgi:DNA-binding transcriptional LysR family regulator
VVPSAIRSFRLAYPDVALSLEEANTVPLLQGLRDGALDAAFLCPGDTGNEDLQLRLLSEEPLVVVLPSGHPIAARPEIELAMLKDEPVLLYPRAAGPAAYDTVIGACREARFEPEFGQTLHSLRRSSPW